MADDQLTPPAAVLKFLKVLFTPLNCVSRMSSGPFYLASVPVAVKDPTFSQCKTCRRFTDASLNIGWAVRASVGYYISYSD